MATTAATATTAPTDRGGCVIRAIFATATLRSKDREQTAYFFAVAFHANNTVSMFVTDQQVKFCLTIRAIVLIQRHSDLPPTDENHHISGLIVVCGLPIVKSPDLLLSFQGILYGCSGS